MLVLYLSKSKQNFGVDLSYESDWAFLQLDTSDGISSESVNQDSCEY